MHIFVELLYTDQKFLPLLDRNVETKIVRYRYKSQAR